MLVPRAECSNFFTHQSILLQAPQQRQYYITSKLQSPDEITTMSTITQPMSSTTQLLAPGTAHLMLTGPTSTFHEFGMANLKIAIDLLVKYKPTITASGMLIPKIMIIDTLGWDELYTGLYTQPSYHSLPLPILAPSASRHLGTKSCVRDGKIEKEVK